MKCIWQCSKIEYQNIDFIFLLKHFIILLNKIKRPWLAWPVCRTPISPAKSNSASSTQRWSLFSYMAVNAGPWNQPYRSPLTDATPECCVQYWTSARLHMLLTSLWWKNNNNNALLWSNFNMSDDEQNSVAAVDGRSSSSSPQIPSCRWCGISSPSGPNEFNNN